MGGVKGSRWVDPAPLEVARPRLPWWTLLPWKAKLLLSPIAAAWVLVWLTAKAARSIWYYPASTVLGLVGLALYGLVGGWWLGGLVLVLAAGTFVWWRQDPHGFYRRVRWMRTELRRASLYAWQWRTVTRLAGLCGEARGREWRPKLKRTRSEWWRDRVRVRMIPGQAPEQWELRASGLAHSFRARSCRVRAVKPGVIELDLVHADPLASALPVPELAATDSTVDLRRVVIGRTETGKPWALRLLGGQYLTVGVQGAGKASVLWSLLWALAPAIRSGSVRVLGIDPKGGMELGQAPELFHGGPVYSNGAKAVELLESVAEQVRERAARFRGIRRGWSADSGEPFLLLVLDELADVIAYQTDRKLKERAQLALQTITSQGRAPGVAVVALVQDPRKEIVPFRNLFTTRIAMRLDEAAQVDMVLGDGVRARGGNAHEIPEATPGVAWVKEDGKRDPVRARAFHVTDTNITELRHYVTGSSATVLPFTLDSDGGAAA
ncbi:FtsK/SpoIIIE domain-containing protein [Actinokineospora sp. UTMC 2448]|uniref:FtsK/SpoIIIE domain-containing protein n=1 Tax=Actinokineospora sp. UTMC 2448 TaxID=2268449 RepID=UPI002164D00B|nr:FtsK/SpoIIIE domain-containing protein [Actinokineospora sp. UTMC 2448]UVS76333.1 DNA translocase FtsK [Actinokineospora sp. UTMC 2448]